MLVFGNTSALYNSGLVMFDHASGSYWFQTGSIAIVGDMTGARRAPLSSSMMSWGDWVELHPTTNLLSREQGLGTRASQYLQDPFLTYADFINEGENWYPFPVDAELVSDLLRPAEVVIAVEINGNERTYPPGRIGDAAVNDVIGGESGIVFSRGDDQIATVFSPLIDPDGRHSISSSQMAGSPMPRPVRSGTWQALPFPANSEAPDLLRPRVGGPSGSRFRYPIRM